MSDDEKVRAFADAVAAAEDVGRAAFANLSAKMAEIPGAYMYTQGASDDDEHFAKITIKPLEIPRACLGETIELLVQALEILDVSYTLREVIEEWCDKHAP